MEQRLDRDGFRALFRGNSQRGVHDVRYAGGKAKIGGHDTDDGVGKSVDVHRDSDDTGIAAEIL